MYRAYHPSTFTGATPVGYGAVRAARPRRRTSPGRAAPAESVTVRRGSRSRGPTETWGESDHSLRERAVGQPFRTTRPNPTANPVGGALEGVASLGVAPQVAHPRRARGRHTHPGPGHGRAHVRGPALPDRPGRSHGRRPAEPGGGREEGRRPVPPGRVGDREVQRGQGEDHQAAQARRHPARRRRQAHPVAERRARGAGLLRRRPVPHRRGPPRHGDVPARADPAGPLRPAAGAGPDDREAEGRGRRLRHPAVRDDEEAQGGHREPPDAHRDAGRPQDGQGHRPEEARRRARAAGAADRRGGGAARRDREAEAGGGRPQGGGAGPPGRPNSSRPRTRPRSRAAAPRTAPGPRAPGPPARPTPRRPTPRTPPRPKRPSPSPARRSASRTSGARPGRAPTTAPDSPRPPGRPPASPCRAPPTTR